MINFPLVLPTTAAPREMQFEVANSVAQHTSPFTGSSQFLEWPAEYMGLTMSLPPMQRESAADWVALLAALRGRAGTFLAGPRGKEATPRGSFPGAPNIKGVQAAQSKSLIVRGFAASQANVLRRGDYIQLCKNYLLDQNFAGANWIRTTGVTATANNIVAPDGTTTADTISYAGGGTTGSYRIYAQAVRDAVNWIPEIGRKASVSIWLKSTGSVTVRLSNNFGDFLTCAVTASWQRFVLDGIGNGSSGVQLLIYSPAGVDTAFTLHAWGAAAYSSELDARLAMVLSDASSDANGEATIDIFPRLREATTDFAPIVATNPKGVFRLKDNSRKWEINTLQRYGISVACREDF